MQNSKVKTLVAGTIIVIIGLAIWFLRKPGKAFGALDEFAKCLRDKQVTMYGANWCPHCQNEKKAFGDAFQHVQYVECTEEPDKCRAAGVQYFPTWIMPNGKKLVGEQGIEKLSEESGCAFPEED